MNMRIGSLSARQLSAVSQVTGAAGGVFALVTFGASLIPCAAAIAAAQNACRIRDEKQQNLTNCEHSHAKLAKKTKEAAKAALKAEQARQGRITQLNEKFANKKEKIIEQYKKMIQDFVNNFAAKGWNMDDPETQELLRSTRANMEREQNQKLDQLELQRKQAVKNA